MQRFEVEEGYDNEACLQESRGIADRRPGCEKDHRQQEDPGHLVIAVHHEEVLAGLGQGFADETQQAIKELLDSEEEEDDPKAGEIQEEPADGKLSARIFDQLVSEEAYGQQKKEIEEESALPEGDILFSEEAGGGRIINGTQEKGGEVLPEGLSDGSAQQKNHQHHPREPVGGVLVEGACRKNQGIRVSKGAGYFGDLNGLDIPGGVNEQSLFLFPPLCSFTGQAGQVGPLLGPFDLHRLADEAPGRGNTCQGSCHAGMGC